MTTDDKIRLILEWVDAGGDAFRAALQKSRDQLDAVAAAGSKAETSTYELADTYEVVASASAHSTQVLNSYAQSVAAADRGDTLHAESLRKMTWILNETTAKQTSLGAAMGKYQVNIRGLSDSMNDALSVSDSFDQRLNALANNMPMLLAGFGSWGLALSAVIPLIAMAYKNWDGFLRLMGEGSSNKIPANVDALKNIETELKAVTKQLDDHKDKQVLSNVELADYNRLSAKQVELERQKSEELERQNALKGLAALKPKDQTERASGFKEAVGEAGGGDAAQAQLRQALLNIAQATGQDSSLETIAKQAEDLMIEASQGIVSSRDTIQRAVTMGLPADQQKFGQAILDKAPETAKAKKAADEKAKADKKEQDLVDDLNERGAENERVMRAADEKAGIKADAEEENDQVRGGKAVQSFRDKARQIVDRARQSAGKEADRLSDPRTRAELGAAGQIAAGTNGQLQGNALEDAAKRSVALQMQGVDAQVANQQAGMETLALVNGLTGRYAMLQQQANVYLRELRQVRAAMAQADQMTFQNMGNGN